MCIRDRVTAFCLLYLAKNGDCPSSSYATKFDTDTSFPLFLDLTKTLLILSGSCLSLISPCKIIEYSFPSLVKFVTLLEPKMVSIVFPISSVETPRSAAFF